MNFDLSEEQALLRETVSRYFERDYDYRAALAGEHDWSKLAEMGVLGAMLPTAAGGFGGSVEAMIVAQAAGERLVLEPLVGQVLVPGTLLAQAGTPVAREALEEVVAGTRRIALATVEPQMTAPFDHPAITTTLVRDGDGFHLTGLKTPVLDGANADSFLVTARDAEGALAVVLVSADAPGFNMRSMRTFDGRGAAELSLDVKLSSEAVLSFGDTAAAIDGALDAGLAASCADLVGAMTAMLDRTREYTGQREQYGAKLATYQSLQHRMADMFIALELARSMAFLAAASLDLEPAARAGAVSGAWHEALRSVLIATEI